jgi:IS5 family transposase
LRRGRFVIFAPDSQRESSPQSGRKSTYQTVQSSKASSLHLIVDSTGLKLRRAGEWLFEKHGTAKRRSWRKLHIGIDAGSGEIVAFDLTDKDVDDASHVEPLLDQLADAPASFMADGAYDRGAVLDAVLTRNPDARFIVPPCKGGPCRGQPWQ